MNRRFALIAALSAMLSLTACGGGSDGDSSPKVYDAPALVKTDTVVGTGTAAALNTMISVKYTLWLLDTTKADSKGSLIEGPASFTTYLGTTGLIQGWIQGIPGMKVGGKRTLIVPASLGYGAAGSGKVPPNSGLVFDVELTEVVPVYDAPALVKTDTTVGTGAEAVVNKNVTVTYTLYQYDSTKADFKGTKVEGPQAMTTLLADSKVIPGFVQGVTGMKVGGKRTIVIPSSLGYGKDGSGKIPPNSGLVFDIDLTAVN